MINPDRKLSAAAKSVLLNVFSGCAPDHGLRPEQAGAHVQVMKGLRKNDYLTAENTPTEKAKKWIGIDNFREVPLPPHLADLVRPDLQK
jgi:hypothetical protein